MKKIVLQSFLYLFFSVSIFGQVITPFTVRKTVTQKGGIVYLSNTSSKATPDNVVQNEMPPSGTGYDNNFTNAYVDMDGDAATWMSSSDKLNLPNCSEVTWAGLYWGADCSTGDENFSTRNQVKLKVNTGVYVDLTADYLKDNTVGFRTYHCFKDITSILKSNGLTDRYTVANVATDIGGKNLFGGWSIVVIYKNNTQTMRNLTVFDGLANVMSSYPTVDIPISGFQTPLAGPVTFELGMVVYDGDRSLTGDQLMFKGVSSFINLSDALHTSTDMFNSTLTRNGVLTPYRNPSYNNNLGYDANIFSPDNTAKNYIGNNAISATIRQTTGGETYLTQVVTSAIDVYEPDLRSAVRVKNITHPGSTIAEKGDILEYTVNGLNIGSDPSVNTFISDTIEGNATYVPGTLKIIYGPNIGDMTDVVGDDQGEYISSSKVVKVRIGIGANAFTGGFVNNSPIGTDSTQFTFRVQATSDCVYLACDNVINNSAFITGTGNVSGNTFDNASNPGIFDAFGCPIPGSTQTTINTTGCSAPGASSNAPICQGGTINFTASASPSATYSWTGPNSFTSTLREPTIASVTNANAGIYTANIYITGTTCHFIYPLNVEINVANAGPDQTGSTTCGLTTATLAGNQPSGTTGLWSITSGTGGSFADNSNPTTTFTGTAGISYTLKWTLSSACPSTSDDVNVKFNQGPTASVLSGTASVCYNGYANIKGTITGGTSPYTITLNNSGGTFANYISGSDLIVGPLTATKTYGFTSVIDANGCSSAGLSGNAVISVSDAITGTGTITQLNAPIGGGGPKTAGTASGWMASGNTTISDNTYASSGSASKGTNLTMYISNFGFAIPVGATILGVEAYIERYYSTTGARTISSGSLRLCSNVSSASTIGNNINITYPVTTKAGTTYGGPTNVWGTTTSTLTPTVVNGTNFGIRVRATTDNANSSSGTATAYIDYITVKIYYSPASAYCDNDNGKVFSVSTYTNATTYNWTSTLGATVTAGQGTSSAIMDFNGAGQSGNYNVCVTASNNCQTLSPSCISIPITDCTNTGNYIMGNVFWDKDGSVVPKIVDGTGIGTANSTQLYVTLEASAGTTALQNSVAVAADGSYKFSVSASTNYKIVLSKNSYTLGQTVVAALPTGCSYNGEKANNAANTLTGNDGSTDGSLSISSPASNNVVNANFGIKISTPPVAVNDVTTTSEDTQVSLNVTTNDTDVDGTVTASTVDLDPSTGGTQTSFSNVYGSWSVIASGLVTFTPAANYFGNASVTYRVNDNDANTSNTANLLVVVNPVNDPPIAGASTFTITENTTHTFLASDFVFTDAESNAMVSITFVTLPGFGTLSLNGVDVTVGQVITAANIANLVYTPETNGHGTPYSTFTFKVNDADLGIVSGTMTIHVTHINVAPVAVNDVSTTNQNVSVAVNLLANDINVDETLSTGSVDLDPLTPLQQTSYPVLGEGTYTDNGSGTITFTPSASFYGTTTPVKYTVSNSLGLVSNTATLTVTVIPLGAPVAVNDDAIVNENSSVTFNVTTNDTDDGTINPSRVDLDPSTLGIQQSYYVSGKGQFSADISGNVTFVPDWNYFGIVTASYTVKDNLNLISNVATIIVTVNWVNATPFAVDDAATTNEDTPVTFNITSNDNDVDGTINVASVDLNLNTAGRQITFTISGEGTYSVDNSGNITFTPVLNFNGTASPKGYTVNDNLGATSDSAIIIVTVNSVNDAPVAVNEAVTAASNTNVVFSITSNDTDVDGTVDATSVDLDPSFPGVQKNYTVIGQGTYTVDNTGMVTFTPVLSFVGPVTATAVNYTVNDNFGTISNSGSITITLTDPSAPQAVNDNGSMNEDGAPVAMDVTSNDVAGSGTIVVSTIDLDPATVGQQTTLSTALGTYSLNTTTGIVTFTSLLNAFGTSSINYTVSDDNATPLVSNIASITVVINSVNDAPSFVKGANQTVCENTGVQIVNNWATAISAGPTNELAQAVSFVTTNNNNALFSDQPAVDATGNLSYTLASNQSGLAVISVNIQDDGGTANSGVNASAIQTFIITVNVQVAPTVGAITQPTCATPTGTVALSGLPSSGTWSITPSTGTPAPGTGTSYAFSGLNPSGLYTFTVTNMDGCTSNASANVTINANPLLPITPTVASSIQPTCGTPSGTIIFNTQTGVEYSIGTGFQAGTTFSNMVPTTYLLSVRNSSDHTCVTTSGLSVTINAIPSPPAIPAVSSITQPTCGTPVGTIVFTTQAGVKYSVGAGYQVSESFSGLTSGFYTLTVQSIADNTCITAAGSAVTINAVPAAPGTPAATSSQNFCNGIAPKISDIAVIGTDIIWYDAASAGNVLAPGLALVNGATYYASQIASGCESAIRKAVTITIFLCTGPNIADYTLAIDENTANTTQVYDVNDVSGADKDVDENNLTYSIVSGNGSGAFTINPTTGIITVADATQLDYETSPTFALVVRASNGTKTNDATITIHLNNLNDNNPISLADNYSVNEGATLSVVVPGVLTNDQDADGNSLTSIKVTNPAHGTLTLNANGSFTYIHDGSETTIDAFTYKSNDGTNNGNTVSVTITINPVNDPPVVSNVSKSVNEDNTLTFAAVDFSNAYTDVDGNPITKIIITSLPVNGILKISGVNVSVHDEILIANTSNLTFTPNANWNGNTSFDWNGFDGTVYAITDASVHITVNAVNDAPVVTDIAKSVNEDVILTFAVADFTGAFTDVDGNSLTKIKIVSLPANGTLKLSGINVNANDEIPAASLANLTFVPDANWNGNTSFLWNGFDGTVYAGLAAYVNIGVDAINDAPVVSDIEKRADEDNIVTFALPDFSTAFSDIDGNSIVKIKITSLPAHGFLKFSGVDVVINDEITAANLGHITFVPNVNWNGGTTFGWNGFDGTTYAVSNAQVNITIDPVNDTPVVSDIAKSINEDNTLNFAGADFTGAFSDADGNLPVKIKITSLPANGTLTLSGGAVVINDEILTANIGNLTFTPDVNWNGFTSFSWNGMDGTLYAASDANVNITVNAVNDAPTVSDIYKSALANVTITFVENDFNQAFADPESDVLVKIKVVSLPANGTLKLSGVSVLPGSEISAVNLANITFVPNTGYTGSDSFTWNGFDGTVYAISNANVDITLSNIPNTPPIVSDIAKSVNEDVTLTFSTADFLGAFTDGEGNSMTKIRIVNLPANGTLKLSGVVVNTNDEIPAASLGNLTFVSNANWNGNTSFGWNGFDGTVYAATNANVNISVAAVNDAPVVSNIAKIINEDNTLALSESDFVNVFIDVDNDPLIKIKITSLPVNGKLRLFGVEVNIHDEILALDLDHLVFVPNVNWNGITSFDWNGFDGTVYALLDAMVNITVNAVNDAPIVTDIPKSVNEDNTLTFAASDFTGEYSDVDLNPLTKIRIISLPANGKLKLLGVDVNINDEISVASLGDLIFEPDADWNGNSSFNWNGFDGTEYAASAAKVNITVNAVNDAPVVSDNTFTGTEDIALQFSVFDFTSSYADIDGNPLAKIKITSLPANGTLKLSGINVNINDEILAAGILDLSFVPNLSWNGSTSFGWNGFDGTVYAVLAAKINIIIDAANDAPTLIDIAKSVNEDNPLVFATTDFTGAYTDIDGNTLVKIKITRLPAHGTLTLLGINVALNDEILAANFDNLIFTPDANWNGSDSFGWNGYDGITYAEAEANVNITVNAVNDAPEVSNIYKSALTNIDITFVATDFTSAYSDIENNILTKITIVSLPLNGTLKLSGVTVTAGDEISAANLANITFSPTTGWNGSTSFVWNGFDGNAYAAVGADVDITISAVPNTPPIVSDISKSVNEDVILTFAPADFANAFTDGESNVIVKVKITSLPAHATLKLSGVDVGINDEISIVDIGNLTFVPDANWNGDTSFGWNGFDGTVYANTSAIVNIKVNAVNDAPVLSDIAIIAEEDDVFTFSASYFTNAFADIDDNPLIKVKIVSLPMNGTLKLSGVEVNVNDEILVADIRLLTFLPLDSWTGGTAFYWTGFDGTTYAVADAIVNITVVTDNDVPTLTDIEKVINEDEILVFSLTDFKNAFSDDDASPISKVKITSLPANGTLKLSGITVNVNDEVPGAHLGNLSFIPDANWNGTTSFTWNGYDSQTPALTDANVQIMVLGINDAPVVTDITKSAPTDVTVPFTAADFTGAYTDVENDPLTKIKIVTLPANGILKLSGIAVFAGDEISSVLLSNITFESTKGWNGNTSFVWNGYDGLVYAEFDANVNISITAVMDTLPVVSDITKSINEDDTLKFAGTDFTESTVNTLVKIKILSLPANGILKLAGLDVNANDEIFLSNLNGLIFIPNVNWNGSTSFGWNGSNGNDYATFGANVNITVNAINDPPFISNLLVLDTISFGSGSMEIDVSGLISDPENDPILVSIGTQPKHGTSIVGANGKITYTPAIDFIGSDTIVYNVCDNGTPSLCVSGTIIITVKQIISVNHIPEISGIEKRVAIGNTLMFIIADFTDVFTDMDNDILVKISILSLPSSGTLLLNGIAVNVGDEINAADLFNFGFVPNLSYTGNVTFSWAASDGKDYSLPNTVTITVDPSETFIPEGFSPNGDGVNDYFIIKGAEKYVVTLSVFNRWGNLVFESKHYENNWDGASNSGLLIGTKLPDGTYFYVINFNNGEKEKIGYITINR